jgi:peptidoglycan/LPS O-acetylase OafA/YrhL
MTPSARDRHPPAGDRLPALDGLRGVAAMVVLLSHVVEAGAGGLSATLALDAGDPGGLAHWLMRTPLAVFWAGPELVIVFFVLSGLVLTRGALRRPVPPAAFLAGRALRLYLPAWLSLAPAALLIVLVPRVTGLAPGGVGFWLDGYAHPVGLEQVARDMALVLPDHVARGEGTLNGVLWSLRWEVLFSLALPVLLLARGALRRSGPAVLLAAVLAVDLAHGRPALMFLPPFLVGMVLAVHADALARLRTRLAGRRAAPAVVLAACLLSADLWLPAATRASGPSGALVLVGAGLAVALPLVHGSVARTLSTAPARWLGSRSFSLYLVHHPIVLAVAYGLRAPGFVVVAAVAIPASLSAAELFHRAVERPCHGLARSATAQVASRAQRRRAAALAPRPA